MTVSLTGELNADLTRLTTSLKNSASFQTWVSATNATEALAYIHSYANDAFEQDRFALVYLAPGWRRQLVDSGNEFVTDAQVVLHLQSLAPDAYPDMGDRARWMTNTLGAIMADVESVSASGGTYLNMFAWEVPEGDPVLPADEETNPQIIGHAIIDVVRD